MSRRCVLFHVACVVCGAGACCVDRCAECVCMECWSLAVYSLHCWTHPNRVGPSRQFRALYFFAEPVETVSIQRKKMTHFSEDLCVHVYVCACVCLRVQECTLTLCFCVRIACVAALV